MILVVGSTGAVGASVVRRLATKGKPVAALVRDPASEKARALERGGAKLVQGDLKDAASVERALAGVDTVICTASSTTSRQDGDSLETVDGKGVQTLIDVAERRGVRRFVYVSFSRNFPSDFPLGEYKRAAEKRLEASTLDYTILLPSAFPDTWLSPVVGFDVAGGKVRVYGDGQAKVSYISLEDVAASVVASVDNPAASRKAIAVGGPKAYSQLEVVEMVERATGRKLEREHMTADQIKGARAAAGDPMSASFLGLFAGLAGGDEIPTDWTRVLGIQPIPLEDWVRRRFGPPSPRPDQEV
jgi:NADH dehydrogenase